MELTAAKDAKPGTAKGARADSGPPKPSKLEENLTSQSKTPVPGLTNHALQQLVIRVIATVGEEPLAIAHLVSSLHAKAFSIFVGFPISFTLIFLAFVFGIWGANFKLTTLLMTLNTNSTMLNDQLMAVPLFVLMGIVMEQAGLMERLFASIQMIMARVRGAL